MIKLKTNQAAMFGLDARIALAIFGALSVISGAALYSAIQGARATALITEMNEIGKAWEQFYLDTGQDLTLNGTTGHNLYLRHTRELVVNPNNIANWKGPYLSYEVDSISNAFLYYPANGTYSNIHLLTLPDSTAWGGSNFWNDPSRYCTSGLQCYLWVKINGFESDVLAKKIDSIVDNGDGPTTGKFKWMYNNDDYKYRYTLKYAPIANPND